MLIDFTSGQTGTDLPMDRTLTPGGVSEEFTTAQAAPPWDVNRSSSFPWPVGADGMQDSVLGQNPFDTEGLSFLRQHCGVGEQKMKFWLC